MTEIQCKIWSNLSVIIKFGQTLFTIDGSRQSSRFLFDFDNEILTDEFCSKGLMKSIYIAECILQILVNKVELDRNPMRNLEIWSKLVYG